MKIITAGCFDILHVGHINLLLFCRQLAGSNGLVWVSLDSDTKMALDKRAPIFSLHHRMDAIESLTLFGNKVVSMATNHDDNDHLIRVINNFKPDYIVVGSDYKDRNVVGSDIANVIFFDRDDRFSSTKIIAACRK
jgi:cytidyltransferase-like protein